MGQYELDPLASWAVLALQKLLQAKILIDGSLLTKTNPGLTQRRKKPQTSESLTFLLSATWGESWRKGREGRSPSETLIRSMLHFHLSRFTSWLRKGCKHELSKMLFEDAGNRTAPNLAGILMTWCRSVQLHPEETWWVGSCSPLLISVLGKVILNLLQSPHVFILSPGLYKCFH